MLHSFDTDRLDAERQAFVGWQFWVNEIQAFLDYMENTELENVEVFHLTESVTLTEGVDQIEYKVGWYWWVCFPGCLPEGDGIVTASGPYLTEQAARLAAYSDQMELSY